MPTDLAPHFPERHTFLKLDCSISSSSFSRQPLPSFTSPSKPALGQPVRHQKKASAADPTRRTARVGQPTRARVHCKCDGADWTRHFVSTISLRACAVIIDAGCRMVWRCCAAGRFGGLDSGPCEVGCCTAYLHTLLHTEHLEMGARHCQWRPKASCLLVLCIQVQGPPQSCGGRECKSKIPCVFLMPRHPQRHDMPNVLACCRASRLNDNQTTSPANNPIKTPPSPS